MNCYYMSGAADMSANGPARPVQTDSESSAKFYAYRDLESTYYCVFKKCLAGAILGSSCFNTMDIRTSERTSL